MAIRKDWCDIHQWVLHEVSDNCYCLEDQGAGYTYDDEHGNCDVCNDDKPVCTVCIRALVKVIKC
jgi:hypothetical protein